MGPSIPRRFEENSHRMTVWHGSSVVRVLAWYVRDPGFESWSAMCFFPPCDTDISHIKGISLERTLNTGLIKMFLINIDCRICMLE